MSNISTLKIASHIVGCVLFVIILVATVYTGLKAAELNSEGLGVLCFGLFCLDFITLIGLICPRTAHSAIVKLFE